MKARLRLLVAGAAAWAVWVFAAAAADKPAFDNVDAIPYVDTDNAKARGAYADFLKAPSPSAFAIAASGAWGSARGPNAEQKALTNCDRGSRAKCVLYAVNGKVVFPFDPNAANYAEEDADWGEAPNDKVRDGEFHAPTPKNIPGAKVITTQALRAALVKSTAPILLDVLGGAGHATIAGAVWMPGAGLGIAQNTNAETALQRTLARFTNGDKSREIVVFCQSAFCWLSYNATLRVAKLGYRNVSWYRGGMFAWRAAGQPVAEAGVAVASPDKADTVRGVQATARPSAMPAKAIPALDFDPGRYHALIIGNNNYANIKKLATAVADATAVANLLRDKYGFEVTLLADATRHQILTALNKLRSTLKLDDNLLIYYAGHGILDDASERGYWLPVDAEEGNTANWVSTADLTDVLKAMDARHVMIVADSCYSGTLLRGAANVLPTAADRSIWLKRMEEKRSRTALTSGGLEPVKDGGGSGHSVFTKAFIEALRDNGQMVEGQALFTLIKQPVVLNAEQTPAYSDIRSAGHDGGDFIFVPLSLRRGTASGR